MRIANYYEETDEEFFVVEINEHKYVDVVCAADGHDGGNYWYVYDFENGMEVYDLFQKEVGRLEDFGLSGQDVIDFAVNYRSKKIEEPATDDRTYEVTELCPNCGREITMTWDTDTDGFKAFCPHCGGRLMLCDECRHCTDGKIVCDYNSETDTCRFNQRV